MAAEERGWQVVLVSMNATSNAAVQAWGEQLPGVASASLEGDGTPLVEVLDELAGVDASPGAGPEGRASTSGRAPLGSSGVGIRLIGCQPGGGATSVSWLRRVAGHWLRTRRDGAPAVVLQVRHERHDGVEPPDAGPLRGPVAVASAPGESPGMAPRPVPAGTRSVATRPRCTARRGRLPRRSGVTCWCAAACAATRRAAARWWSRWCAPPRSWAWCTTRC